MYKADLKHDDTTVMTDVLVYHDTDSYVISLDTKRTVITLMECAACNMPQFCLKWMKNKNTKIVFLYGFD